MKHANIFAKAAAAAVLAFAAAAQALAQDTVTPRRSSLIPGRTRPGAAQQTDSAASSSGAAAAAFSILRDPAAATNSITSLNFNEAELEIVLASYSREVGKTIIRDPKLPTGVKISLCSPAGQELTRESYLKAIEAALQANGVSLEPYGPDFILALPRQDVYKKGIPLIMEHDGLLPENSRAVSVWIPLKHLTAEEAQKALEKGFKSDTGMFQVFERANAMLVTDTQENVNRILEILKVLDVKLPANEEVFTRELAYAAAADIKARLLEIVNESQKEQQSKDTSSLRQSGPPGFVRGTQPSNPRSFAGRRETQQESSAAAKANESIVASVDDASRGVITGKVLILDDERSNKLIIITKKSNMDFFDKVIKELDVKTEPDVRTEMFRLRYATAKDVADNINSLLNGGSSSTSRSGSQNTSRGNASSGGSNLTRGSAGNSPSSSSAQRPNTAAARSGNAAVEETGRLSKETTTVLADERINGVIVQARKQDMATISNIISKLDVQLSQVLIETVFIQVALGDDIVSGIDWIHGLSNGAISGGSGMASPGILPAAMRTKTWNPVTGTLTSTGSDGESSTTTSVIGYDLAKSGIADITASGLAAVASNAVSTLLPGSAGINYYLRSDKLNLEAIIKASKTDNHAKFLSAPVIMTLDNKEATFEATEMRYLLKGYTYSGNTYSGSAVPDYEQKDIGITIKVTPKINPDGTVLLTVDADFKQIGADQTIKASTGNSGQISDISVPTFTTRKLTADISVDNMETVVFGGMVQTTKSHAETGIPLLKDIPWIGKWLFGSVSDSESRAEVLVFITPYVVDSAEAARREAERRKAALSDERPFDTNGWSVSPIADPVSAKERLRKQAAQWAIEDEERETKRKIEEAKEERRKEIEKREEDEARRAKEREAAEAEKEAERPAESFKQPYRGFSALDYTQPLPDAPAPAPEAPANNGAND